MCKILQKTKFELLEIKKLLQQKQRTHKTLQNFLQRTIEGKIEKIKLE